jgi:hypothetical protein
LDYSENGVITSCIPTVKCAENKLVSAVSAHAELGDKYDRWGLPGYGQD